MEMNRFSIEKGFNPKILKKKIKKSKKSLKNIKIKRLKKYEEEEN